MFFGEMSYWGKELSSWTARIITKSKSFWIRRTIKRKQKIKRSYGLLETQFRNYFEKANKQKGRTGENLIKLLERRLDNVVFRLGFASSRKQARQLITHRHIMINNSLVTIPAYLLKAGDVIQVKEKSKN